MKKLSLLLIVLMSFVRIGFGQVPNISTSPNISTGVDASGNALNMGATDTYWKITPPSSMGPNAYVIPSFSGYWENTPASNNAQWIGGDKNNQNQKPGLHTFERQINISSGISLFSYNFSIAVDDDLSSIELLDPTGKVTDLTSKFVRPSNPNGYKLSKPISGEIQCPLKGVWKLRVKVNFVDNIAGLIVSGNVSFKDGGNCGCKIPDVKCNPDFTVILSPNGKNGPNSPLIEANPIIVGSGTEHYWGVVYAKDVNDISPIPIKTIISGKTWGSMVDINGKCSPVGIDGTNINCGKSGYGYNYGGFPTNSCFKITHYIKCCDKWYSKTKTFCTKAFCIEQKETEMTEVKD